MRRIRSYVLPFLPVSIVLALLALAVSITAHAQSISGVVNIYTPVTGVDDCNGVQVVSTTGFRAGDTVLIIQMKGASIESSTASSFGTILDYGTSGNYELGIIDFIDGTTVYLRDSLLRSYSTSGLVQLIRVPHYTNVTVTGTVTAPAWNGSTGGVVVIDATGIVRLNADIDVTGRGFRGGAIGFSRDGDLTDWVTPLFLGRGGEKGEAIAVTDALHNASRAPLANGGGGANAHNSGGGGGGHFARGGKGGDQYDGAERMDIGGHGGRSIAGALGTNRIYFGGAGGGGHENDSVGTMGANGGGIVIIRAAAIAGNGRSIIADGAGAAAAGRDGAGGGGAGGTVVLQVPTYLSAVTLSARGGKGGDNDNSTLPDCHGTGGGGAGGVIRISSATLPLAVTANTAPGNAGLVINTASPCYNTTYGAEAGNAGTVITSSTIPQSITPHRRIQLVAGTDVAVCSNDSIQLQALGAPSVHWTPSQGLSCTDCPNPKASPATTTTYRIEVPGKANCYLKDSVTVTVNPAPTPTIIGRDTTICLGDSIQLRVAPTGGSIIRWTPSSSVSCSDCAITWAHPTTNTAYRAFVENESGCVGIDTIFVAVTIPPPLDVGPNQIICPGDSIELTAAGVTEAHWTPAAGLSCTDCPNPKASPAVTTIYRAIGRSAGSCAMTGEVTVTVRPQPSLVMLASSRKICVGDTTDLSALGAGTIAWDATSDITCTDCATPRVWPTRTTTYRARLTDANGCMRVDSVTVEVLALPTLAMSVDTTICAGNQARLSATTNGTVVWSPSTGLSCADCAQPIATPAQTTMYHLTATSLDGCHSFDSVLVTVDDVVSLTARMTRDHKVAPGREVIVPVLLDGIAGPKQRADSIRVTVRFAPRVLRLRRIETTGGVLENWRLETKPGNGEATALLISPPTLPQSHLEREGPILYLTFGGYIGDADSSELPIEISFPGSRCLTAKTVPGKITVDSLCGIGTRLFVFGAGKLAIESISPNPFNPSAEIRFTTPFDGRATIEILDGAGRRVALPVDGELGAGEHTIRWDGSQLSSGVYYCRLHFGEEMDTRTMVLVK